MAICYSNITVIACLLVIFVIIIIKITIIIIIIIIATIIIIIEFFWSYAQNVVFDVRKKRYKLPEMRGGGGIWAMPETKHFFLCEVFPQFWFWLKFQFWFWLKFQFWFWFWWCGEVSQSLWGETWLQFMFAFLKIHEPAI